MKIIAFFLTALLTACSFLDSEKDDYFQEIDEMQEELNAMESKLLSNEIDTLPALQVATNTVELRIKNNLVMDTIDMSLAKKLNAYKVMRRSLGPIGSAFQKGKKSIIEQRETLKNLRKDIENGSGERDKYRNYIGFEKEKVKKISTLIADYVNQKNKTMKTFFDLHSELNTFSLTLIGN